MTRESHLFCLKTIIDQMEGREDNLIIFIRHAEKKALTHLDEDMNLTLTKQGVRQSYAFGNYLKEKFKVIGEIKTSPVKRCVQTAKILSVSFNHIPIIKLSNILGNPGVYVKDGKAALQTFMQYNIYQVVQSQLSGIPLPGMRDIAEGTQLLLTEVWNDLNKSHHPIIYISHDVILAAFIGRLIGNNRLNQDQWIHYLNGFCLSHTNGTLFAHVVNQQYEIVMEKINDEDIT